MALLDCDAARSRDILQPREEREVRIADGQPFEINVAARHDIEQVEISVAIENGLAIAGPFDDDGLFRRAAVRQIIGAIGRSCSSRPSVFEMVVLIDAGMDQNDVAGLGARRIGIEVVGMRGAGVVSRHQSGKGRLLLFALIIGGINMVDLAAWAGFGSARVRTVTTFSRFPATPSGSDKTKRHSYSVAGSRSKMLPASMFGVTY